MLLNYASLNPKMYFLYIISFINLFGPIKLKNSKMTVSPMNMKHSNFAVKTDSFLYNKLIFKELVQLYNCTATSNKNKMMS